MSGKKDSWLSQSGKGLKQFAQPLIDLGPRTTTFVYFSSRLDEVLNEKGENAAACTRACSVWVSSLPAGPSNATALPPGRFVGAPRQRRALRLLGGPGT
jgi:hypothetical protein